MSKHTSMSSPMALNLSLIRPGKAADNVIAAAFQKVERDSLVVAKLEQQNPARFQKLTSDESPIVRGPSRLVDPDFPFDDSQRAAVTGMLEQQYACLTGAAGTGKTKVTQLLIDTLVTDLAAINVKTYWSAEGPDEVRQDKYIPAVALVAFTGKATQMVKENFPTEWHGNIMTIHRMLGFKPEFYEDWNGVNPGSPMAKPKTKMRFVPTYTAENKLPWQVICIDEAGMLGLELWNQLWEACTPDIRIYMIGDINQLPPVHGRSIFGFAMTKWPTFELNTIHRQKGESNPIVEAAWEIIHGRRPAASDGASLLDPTKPGFYMQEVKGDSNHMSKMVRGVMNKLRDSKVYEPLRDTVIVPTNGYDPESVSYPIGQIPLNNSVAALFNTHEDRPRYRIDAGREHRDFAVMDKVMATRNDYSTGITNGMMGEITEINMNGDWFGDGTKFGKLSDIRARHSLDGLKEDDTPFDLELVDDLDALSSMLSADEAALANEEKNGGPASHIVTVIFGKDTDSPITLKFSTEGEVASIQLAYLVTGHKMQGGQAPVVIIVIHDSAIRMSYREWLYTAVTRAQTKCILLYSRRALVAGLGTQKIKGRTLEEKVASFLALSDTKRNPMAVKVRLPEAIKIVKEVESVA